MFYGICAIKLYIYLRFTCASTAWELAFTSTTRRPRSEISGAIYLITDTSETKHFQMTPKFVKIKEVYGYFVL